MNKVYIIDENKNKNVNKFKIFKNSRLNIKKLFAKKINYEKDKNIDENKIKIKNNCLKNIFIKFRLNY